MKTILTHLQFCIIHDRVNSVKIKPFSISCLTNQITWHVHIVQSSFLSALLSFTRTNETKGTMYFIQSKQIISAIHSNNWNHFLSSIFLKSSLLILVVVVVLAVDCPLVSVGGGGVDVGLELLAGVRWIDLGTKDNCVRAFPLLIITNKFTNFK